MKLMKKIMLFSMLASSFYAQAPTHKSAQLALEIEALLVVIQRIQALATDSDAMALEQAIQALLTVLNGVAPDAPEA
jgi:hypothetical protein